MTLADVGTKNVARWETKRGIRSRKCCHKFNLLPKTLLTLFWEGGFQSFFRADDDDDGPRYRGEDDKRNGAERVGGSRFGIRSFVHLAMMGFVCELVGGKQQTTRWEKFVAFGHCFAGCVID